jgi:superfamily II DNA/RNA helicase
MTPDITTAGAELAEITFSDFSLAEPIQRAVAQMGYQTPTPVQAAAIPVVMSGRDVMAAAQTGTGKTAGFALPILQRLLPLAEFQPFAGPPSRSCPRSCPDPRIGGSDFL